eukprot:gb/GFBE01079981.1/.p1 GENE.gb/GFBE01079981.1/~~gb/GFBE01079981.1/.p1  ORF type:complete len:363 (+),score=114.25 gb/GFBE01079981.1/:1-1089(+)
MGSGASAPVLESVRKASVDDLRAALAALPEEQRKLLAEVVESDAAAAAEPVIEMSELLEKVFRCFDADEDGQICREEYLECWEKLAEILDESFGPKQRKEKMKWFKDAGAEGDPSDGMFLARDKWQEAFLATAASESSIAVEDDKKLASWIWTKYAKKLVGKFFPSELPQEIVVVAEDGTPMPEYPITIPLTELASAIDIAKQFGKRVLIASSGLDEVDTFFQYKHPDNLTIDGSMLFMAQKGDKRALLKRAMENAEIHAQAPLLVKLGKGANDIHKCCGEDFPDTIFDGESWTFHVAHGQEFITDHMKSTLECNPEKWKDFTVIILSSFGLDEAKDKLSDKIPHFDKLAILVVDPRSVAQA